MAEYICSTDDKCGCCDAYEQAERIVRCKDCMWHTFVMDDDLENEYEMCAAWGEETVSTGFCHHGKLRELKVVE